MRTLVTGGAGFIGSNVVDALLARGDEVVVVDDLSTGRESNLDGARSNAAQLDVRKSVADPAADARINVEGTINVLEAARRANVPRLVNTSTGGAIYGDVDTITSQE